MITSQYFNISGTASVFASNRHIASKQHCSVWTKSIANVWSQVQYDNYDLVNNSIVLNTPILSTLAIQAELRVADSQEELGTSPTDISILAGLNTEIELLASKSNELSSIYDNIDGLIDISDNIVKAGIVADNIANVNTVADNIDDIVIVKDNTTNINIVASDIANVNTVATKINNIDTVATNITNVNTTSTNINNINTTATNINNINTTAGSIDNVNTVATKINNIDTVATNIVDINQIVDNLPEILLADANATIATIKASESLVSATSASTSASQALTSRNQAETFAQQAKASAKLVDSIAELKLISGSNDDKLEVFGYYTKGDGGDGTFYWDSTSTEADNGGTIIQATGITTGRWKRVFSGAVNVKWFGAKGDGVTDDTVAVQKTFLINGYITFPANCTFNITDTVVVTSNQTIDATGSIIKWTGVNTKPTFKITGAISNVSFKGGLYTGESASWLYAEGSSYINPTSSDSARFSIDDVRVSGAIIFVDAQKAARFKISNCQTYTKNGINGYGKIVELHLTNSVIFGSSGISGTYGIRADMYPGSNSNNYPEGYHISNCTIDGFEKSIYYKNIYVSTITGCWISSSKPSNDGCIFIGTKGTGTHLEGINITGCTLSGSVRFDNQGTGTYTRSSISNNIFYVVDYGVYIDQNNYFITVEGNRFIAPTGTGNTFAVFVLDNVSNITVTNNNVASSFTRIYQSSGLRGSNIRVYNNNGDLAQPTYISRPTYLRNNGTDDDTLKVQLTGTVTSGNYWGNSISVSYTKGEKFLLIINGGFSTTTTGSLVAEMPTGLITPNGSGWDDGFMYIGANPSYTKVSRVIPIYANSDNSGVIKLKNHNITTIDTWYHCTMSLVKI